MEEEVRKVPHGYLKKNVCVIWIQLRTSINNFPIQALYKILCFA